MTMEGAGGSPQHTTQVDLGGLMAVLSDHLYSTRDVVLRELVQNAHDSIARRRAQHADAPEGRIDVAASGDSRVLTVSDNGGGLSLEEVHAYLATVGAGATGRYRTESGATDQIGMFGLGFLSAFVVADEVVVTTTSASTPDATWEYRSSDGHSYSVLPTESAPVGTTVQLYLDRAHADLARSDLLAGLLRRYCRLLPIAVHLDGSSPVNLSPPWRGDWASASNTELLSFAKQFETRFEPIAAIRVDAADDLVSGALWIHGGSSYGNADNRQMAVAVRGMLITDEDTDLLPRWAGFVSGVVESTQLNPTASRESLRHDVAYGEAQLEVAEALVSGLVSLAERSPAVWQRVVERHGEALRGAAVTDDRLFDLVADLVPIPTSQGDRRAAQLTVGRLLYVTLGAERGFEEIVFRAQGLPIARGDHYGVLAFLRRYADRHDLVVVEIGTDDGNSVVFGEADLEEDDLAWLQSELADADEVVVASRFSPPALPLAVIPDREAELRERLRRDDLRASTGDGPFALAQIHADSIGERPLTRIYVNLDCPTMHRVIEARRRDPAGAVRALSVLRSIKDLMAASDRGRAGERDLAATFERVMAVVDGVLLGTTGTAPEEPS